MLQCMVKCDVILTPPPILLQNPGYANGHEEVQNCGKLLFMQSIVEIAGGGMHPPHPPPFDPPLRIPFNRETMV